MAEINWGFDIFRQNEYGSVGSGRSTEGRVPWLIRVVIGSRGDGGINAGCSISDLIVNSGGSFEITGYGSDVTIYGSENTDGTVTGMTVMSGGTDTLHGLETDVTIMSGGNQSIYYGTVSGATVYRTESIGQFSNPATATHETIMSGGVVYINGTGVFSDSLVVSGATVHVGQGTMVNVGFQSGAIINAYYSSNVVLPDGVSGPLGGHDANITLGGNVSANVHQYSVLTGTLNFVGLSNTLDVQSNVSFNASVTGFGTTDQMILESITYGGTTSLVYSGNTRFGVLSVTDGTNLQTINFAGDYSQSNFAESGVVGGATVITYNT